MRTILQPPRLTASSMSLVFLLGALALQTAWAAAPTVWDFGYRRMAPRTTWPTLVIMVQFTDRTFPNDSTNYWDRFTFNRTNNPSGINTYFGEVSNEQFLLARGGTIKITESPTNRWNAMNARIDDAGLTDHLFHSNLVWKAMASGKFNFAPYDSDHSGYVTQGELLILLLINGEGGGVRWAGTVPRSPGQSVGYDGSVGSMDVNRSDWFQGSVHELCHLLGAIDLYGIWGTDQDLNNNLSVMSMGLVHPDPWHKTQFGWCAPRILSLREGGRVNLPAAPLGNTAPVVLYDPSQGLKEFWFAEYRTRTNVVESGFEAELPGNGLVLWHVFHDAGNNVPNYADVVYPSAEKNWRECIHCRSLYSTSYGSKPCASSTNSYLHEPFVDDHRLVLNVPSDPGQHNWKRCTKCAQLFYGPSAAESVCPKDKGVHTGAASDYALNMDTPDVVGHNNWRRCGRCETLYYEPRETTSVCPLGGRHSEADSHKYTLIAGWSDRAMLAEGRHVTTNGTQFVLGRNGMWPSNSVTPYLQWYADGPTPFRIEVDPFTTGAHTINITVLGEYDTWVDFAYAGSPEEGTFARPWDTLAEGVTASGYGGTVKIKTGHAADKGHITRRMKIVAFGGPVTLGRP